jgi:hypothetical protein
MQVCGLDFTSAPAKRKPLVAVGCRLDGNTLHLEGSHEMASFDGLEEFLKRPGPWVCGMDFPFGQPKTLIESLGWPKSWEGYVGEVASLSKDEFEGLLRADLAQRPRGQKYRYRLADRRAGSSSAMSLFYVPVGKMFFRGGPILLRSGVSVVPCRENSDTRTAVESYPALVARRLIGRTAYKNDDPKKQTPHQREVRERLVNGLRSSDLAAGYGLTVGMDEGWRERLVEEPAADTLDSLLCAVQVAWAYRSVDWGIPLECDADEGWIPDPILLENTQ